MPSVAVIELMKDKTAVGTGSWVKTHQLDGWLRHYQATVKGTGPVSATVDIYGRNDDATTGVLLATLTCTSATNESADGLPLETLWPWIRAEVTALSGSGARVSASVSGPSSYETNHLKRGD